MCVCVCVCDLFPVRTKSYNHRTAAIIIQKVWVTLNFDQAGFIAA